MKIGLQWLIALIAGIISVVSVIIYIGLDRKAEKIYTVGVAGDTDKIVFSDIFKFNRSFWYITLLCVTFYSAVFHFRPLPLNFLSEYMEPPVNLVVFFQVC